MDGLVLHGEWGGLEAVTYSATGAKPEKAGEPVPGLWRMIINVPTSNGVFARKLTVNEFDFEGEPTPFWRHLEQFEVAEGDRVACAVRSKIKGGYVELESAASAPASGRKRERQLQSA